MYYVYFLQSGKDGSFYIGHTENLKKRLEQHNSGMSTYTKRKTPWQIVYTEVFETRMAAQQRERFLKKQRNRNFYEKLIKNWSGSSVG